MNLSRIVPFVCAFWILLLAALAVRFEGSTGAPVFVSLIIFASLSLGVALRIYGFKNNPVLVPVAVLLGPGLFAGISAVEDHLSALRLDRVGSISSFGGLSDHCGVHSGRAVIRLFDALFMSREFAALREYRIGTACRLQHFIRLEKADRLGCAVEEGPIRCRTRWMLAFSEHGFWNLEAREHFFESVMEAWRERHDDEALVGFALEDQRLQMSLLGEYRQAGIGSPGSDASPEAVQTKARHRELSMKIFEKVADAIQDGSPAGPAEPWRFKFHDAWVDLREKGRDQL